MQLNQTLKNLEEKIVSKVPAITLGFWIIKILCTTLGETGGDAVTMTWKLGYLIGTVIFLSLLLLLIAIQTKAKKFHRHYTGQQLSLRPPLARPWLILPTVRLDL